MSTVRLLGAQRPSIHIGTQRFLSQYIRCGISIVLGVPLCAAWLSSLVRRKLLRGNGLCDHGPEACDASTPTRCDIGCWRVLFRHGGCRYVPGVSLSSSCSCHDRYKQSDRPAPGLSSTHGPGKIGRVLPSAAFCCHGSGSPPAIQSSPSPDGWLARRVSEDRDR